MAYKLLKDKITKYVDDTDIIGISVVGTNQIIPAFMIAAIIKRENPKVKIIMGGSIISRWRESISKKEFFFECVDYYIYNEGEKPLHLLLKHLDGEIPIEDVPNISFIQKTEE